MIDGKGRQIDYLRISVTDRCNLRCMYCMPEAGISQINHEDVLRFEEIFRIVNSAARLGIGKVRITGGEPLTRLGLPQFIKDIKGIDGINEISMTTNGIFLEDYMEDLVSAGLDRVNISLDTLNAEKFKKITRKGNLEKVLKGIELSLENGIAPVKVNVVIMKGINDNEIMDFVGLAEQYPLHIRFIELMPIGEGKAFTGATNDEIKGIISENRELTSCCDVNGSGPAKYYKTPNSKGSIGFISPMSHGICSSCNRIRLTADGYLKLCLYWENGINLKQLLRNGINDNELETIIKKAILLKPSHHEFNSRVESESRIMSQIGG